MRDATSIQMDRQLWKYIGWVPRLVELLVEIERVRKLLPRLTVPTQTFQSVVDELVADRSCKDLEKCSCIRNTRLHRSGHFAYAPEDMALMKTRLKALIESLK